MGTPKKTAAKKLSKKPAKKTATKKVPAKKTPARKPAAKKAPLVERRETPTPVPYDPCVGGGGCG